MWVLFTHRFCLGLDIRFSHLPKDMKAMFSQINRDAEGQFGCLDMQVRPPSEAPPKVSILVCISSGCLGGHL